MTVSENVLFGILYKRKPLNVRLRLEKGQQSLTLGTKLIKSPDYKSNRKVIMKIKAKFCTR